MTDDGKDGLWFGDSWAIYRGEAPDQEAHVHAAIQIVFADAGRLEILSAELAARSGPGFAVRPLVEHHLRASGPITLLYVEPQSPLAFIVADLIGDDDIAEIALEALSMRRARTGSTTTGSGASCCDAACRQRRSIPRSAGDRKPSSATRPPAVPIRTNSQRMPTSSPSGVASARPTGAASAATVVSSDSTRPCW